MDDKKITYILHILYQVGGPVNITYQFQQLTGVSEKLINYHQSKLESLLQKHSNFFEEYSVSDIYSLYMCLKYIIMDLGVDEFETIMGQDFFNSGFKLLIEVKQYALGSV